MSISATSSGSPVIQGGAEPKVSQQPTKPQQIFFEKIFLAKTEEATESLIGTIAITQDNNHKGWLHILIYIGQLFNSIISWKKRDSVNLCHAQIIIDINKKEGKKGDLILAHSLLDGGIKTTSENHKTDKVITGVYVYRPVDEKMRNLFKQYAEQTAVNFKAAGLDKKNKDFKSRVKKEVGQFSITRMITSAFHRQVLKPYEYAQKQAAYAAADLLKGDKLRDEKGNLASHFCTPYVMTLTQGTALISALSEEEQTQFKVMTRDQIAQGLLQRIKSRSQDDAVSAVYWNNKFMQMDASHTLSYAAADVLDESVVGTAA